MNYNNVVHIPKTSNVDTLCQCRPISMDNFKLNKISKVPADRLSQILPTLISKEQRGFVYNMNIKDCICLTLEEMNMLHQQSLNGNLAIKIDITKVFDTLD